MTSSRKLKISDLQVAIVLAIIALPALLLTAPDIGLTWDEPAYIAAAESYSAWFGELFTHPGRALSSEGIDRYWEVNHEHPPLDKVWSGLVWRIARLVFNDLTAHRLGNMLLAAALVGMLYLLVAKNYGRIAGLIAAGVLISLPRFFFHAHLASLDVPAAVMVFAVLFVFWQTKDKPGWPGTVALGVVWGLAVATKINAVFVMPVILLWVLLFQREKALLQRIPLASGIAFAIFVLSWPWLWPAPLERIIAYIRWITVDHWQIGQYYLHKFYMPPPWHFPFVMTVAVVPTIVLLAYFGGVAKTVKDIKHRELGSLLVLNSLAPLLALSIGQSMVYDNERLFMPAFVFIAALAGVGADWALTELGGWLQEKGGRFLAAAAGVLVVLMVFLPQVVGAASLYPHLLSYYSGTLGGLPGAVRIGLETTYWCETYPESFDYLNQNAGPGEVVWADPWSHDVLVYYQQLGWLRDDFKIAVPPYASSLLDPFAPLVEMGYKESDYIVLHYRQTSTVEGGASWPILSWLKGLTPDVQVTHQGIPLIEVYHNP